MNKKISEKLMLCRIKRHAPERVRLTTNGKIIFGKRLARYLQAGIPIVQALMLIQEDHARGPWPRAISLISQDVQGGRKLSEALTSFKKSYGIFETTLIAVGESSGTLTEHLLYHVSLLERRARLQRKIFGALLYPAILLLGTIGITSFLMFYAFPKLIPLFKSFHATLPITTRILITIHRIATHYTVLLFVILLLISTASTYLLGLPSSRRKLERILLHVPFAKTIQQYYYLSSLHRILAVLLKSGMRIDASLSLTLQGIRNSVYRDSLITLERSVREGQRYSTGLRAYPLLYPSVAISLIAAGEMTGTLSESCFYIAELYEEKLDDCIHTLSELIEPALMVVMGALVGFVALAIITPLYALTQNLGT